MPPKRAFNWKKLYKVKRRWFNNFQWRSSRQTPSMPRPDIVRPHFAPVYPHQDRINQITRSVGSISTPNTIIPVIIFDKGDGSYCLLFESSHFFWKEAQACRLNLPNNQGLELPNRAQHDMTLPIQGHSTNFATLSHETRVHYQPTELGQDVTRNQIIYLFDFRYGSPWIEKGSVNYVDDTHFLFDSKVHDRYLAGALAFDEANRLVGVVYGQVGSPTAIKISHLRRNLAGMIPVAECIDHGGGAGPSSSSGGSSSGGSD